MVFIPDVFQGCQALFRRLALPVLKIRFLLAQLCFRIGFGNAALNVHKENT
jgi:hypothetical protein